MTYLKTTSGDSRSQALDQEAADTDALPAATGGWNPILQFGH